MSDNNIILKVNHISKSFGAVRALDDVSIDVRKGEVYCIIGENGAGKSTLGGIIAGIIKEDKGKMFVDGEKYKPMNIQDANRSRISITLQEPTLVSTLTVSENIYLCREGRFKRFGILNVSKMNKMAKEEMEKLNIKHIFPKARVRDLNYEDWKLVELTHAVSLNPKIIIVDEASAALSKEGYQILIEQIKKITQKGGAVLYISHRLNEIFELGDRVAIMKDGKVVAVKNVKDTDADELPSLMVGREIETGYYREDWKEDYSERVVLSVEGLTVDNLFRDVSFKLHEGEILGVGGLTGSGSFAIGSALFGDLKLSKGSIYYLGKKITLRSPAGAKKLGIGYLPRERDKEGLILRFTIKDNITLPNLDFFINRGFISLKKEMEAANQSINLLRIKTPSSNEICLNLSGGNRQKVSLAKWIVRRFKVMILNCPTRGVDVGVKGEIYQFIVKLREQGISVIIISDELPELIGICDRVLIMRRGKISKIFRRSIKPTEDLIIKYMV